MLEYDKMRVADLRKLCKEKGLAISGTKSELVERLQVATEDDADDADDDLLNDDDGLEDATVDDDDDVELKETTPTKVTSPAKLESTKVAKPAGAVKITAPAPVVKKASIDSSPEKGDGEKVVKLSEPLTEAQRIAIRAAKFGVVSEESKKALRADRFGLASTTKPSTVLGSANQGNTTEKLKQRAERFGTVTSSAGAGTVTSSAGAGAKSADIDKLKQRAERFGTVTSTELSKVDSKEKLLKRKMRFGAITSGGSELASEDAKKSRAERFGIST